MKKENLPRKRLANALISVKNANITSMDDLKKSGDEKTERIYAELFLALEDYVSTVRLFTRQETRKGVPVKGNAEKIRKLRRRGLLLEDIIRDVMLHLLDKSNRYFFIDDTDRAINTLNVCISNRLNDMLKDLPPEMESLDKQITENENSCELIDLIPSGYSLHDEVADTEQCFGIIQRCLEKLGHNPMLMLAWLARSAEFKPRELADILEKEDSETILNNIIESVSMHYNIPAARILECIKNINDEMDFRTVEADDVSRLTYLAKDLTRDLAKD